MSALPDSSPAPGDDRAVTSAHRRAVSYIDKSREFYAAHGYTRPYQWAVHDDVPFAPLGQPLTEARVGVVTTSFPVDGPRPKRTTTVSSSTPDAMYTDDLSWHKDATHTDDVDSFLPLEALRRARAAGRIGDIGPRLYCVPTRYSRRQTLADAEQVVSWCQDDGVDLVLLVPL